ncbi:MAG: hypothetical protein M1324_00265 [Patescibacteria group bacterium]|nr:hypothetical protein [Patescibacteria group bacterium]
MNFEIIRSKKKIILIVVAILGLIIITVLIVSTIQANRNRHKDQEKALNDGPAIGTANNDQKNSTTKNDNNPLASLPACKNTKELFTTFPVKDGDYTSITPLGNLNPTGHTFPTDHIYVQVVDPQHPETNTLDKAKSLIAPADMWIFGVQSSEQIGGIIDYGIDFSPCKDIKGKFGHVGSISSKIQTEIAKVETKCNEYETGGHKYRSCSYDNLKIEVKAGEKIGTAGSERSGMLDIWMSDYREPQIKRANESRWNSDRNYVSCFLDYYPTSLKDKFYDLLSGPNGGKRTKEPRCGTVEVDIAGTAQGVWFYNLQGQTQQEDQHLALVFDNVNTDKQFFSVGTAASSAGITSGIYSFVPKTEGKINRDFSQVTADGTVYCYDAKNNGASKSILLTMPTAEKLRLKKSASSCGAGPWQMPDGFVEYDR